MSFWTPFHREWGKAKEAPDYDKASWVAMQAVVEGLENELAKWCRNGLADCHASLLVQELSRRLGLVPGEERKSKTLGDMEDKTYG
jgi:hypothetical protein